MSLTPPRAASISSESLDQLEEVTSQAAWSEHDKPSARTSSANSSPNPQSLHSFQSGQVSEELEPAATLEPAHPISESPPASKPQHERPFSLQSVASSSSEQITRPSSLATTKHRPANLNLDLASNTDEGALETLHTNVDIDLDDLETVPPSTATPSASSSHQALPTARSSSPFNNNRVASPSSVSSFTDVAVSSPAHPSVQGSPSKTPALANSANGKVSSLRNRFEQSSPTYSGAPHSATTAASSGRYSPLTPPSSADKRKSVQMLQADFQRKKFEMQQAQFNLTRQNSGEPIPSVDRKQKQKETEQQPPQDQSIVSEIDDIDWDFWSLVVNDYTAVARDQPKRLSEAIQMGIPQALRGLLWQLMSSSKDLALEDTYSSLLKMPSSHEKAIMRDINRTFPHHKYFQDEGIPGRGAGQDNLFNVCKCYSLHDEEVGYCQGLQFLIGPLLLNMPDEEAFCVLVRLMQSYGLRTHYTPAMPGLQMRLFQFDKLLEELLPVTFMHLTRQGVKSSMYASQWWLTLFGYRFPLELVQCILDLVLAEGVEAVFRFSIALIQHNEEAILKLEFEDIVDFLKNTVYEKWKNVPATDDELQYDARRFVQDALSVRIAPTLLDQFASEWDAMKKEQDAHHLEVEGLRRINTQLSLQVRQLESSLASINEEHCELVKQVVQARLEKESLEEELVKYKLQCAELAHRRDSASAGRPSFTPPFKATTLPPPKEATPSAGGGVAAAATSFFGGMRPSWGRKETVPATPTPPRSASARDTASSFSSQRSRSNSSESSHVGS